MNQQAGINRRTFLSSTITPLAVAAGLGAANFRKPPNVLLILADDQGYGDLSYHGNPYLKTPHLDDLAKQSTEFTRFYVSPVCAPTRASLLTGRYNMRCGVHGVTAGRETMSASETTIAEALKPAGYHTALFGKWHLGSHYPNVPHAQGFDEFIGFRFGHWIDYYDPQFERNGKPYPLHGYVTDALTDQAIRFVRERANDPFFLYLAYNVPHAPFMAPERHWKIYSQMGLPQDTAAAYALTACMDENIGRLLHALEENGIANDTIVIFLSDNGPNGDRYNCGLRGKKGSVYEGGNREPFFIRWPGHISAGKRIDTIAAHIDVYPTLLDLCGVNSPKGNPIDGRSLVPLIRGNGATWHNRMLFVHSERPVDPNSLYPGTVRTQQFNLVNGQELYEIPSDPGEQKNIAADHPQIVEQLRAAYKAWFQDVLPPGGLKRLPIPVGYEQENPATLYAPEAYLSGGITYYGKHGYAHDFITNWTTLAGSVLWNLDVVRQGQYQVTLKYLCPEGSTGAEVEIAAGDASSHGVIQHATDMNPVRHRDLVPRTEAPAMHWQTMTAGILALPEGKTTLTVKAISKPGPIVMDLKEVILTRVK